MTRQVLEKMTSENKANETVYVSNWTVEHHKLTGSGLCALLQNRNHWRYHAGYAALQLSDTSIRMAVMKRLARIRHQQVDFTAQPHQSERET